MVRQPSDRPGYTTLQLVALPAAAVIDETIRLSVLALMHGKGAKKEALMDVLGASRGTVFNKLAPNNPRPFTAAEVARLAAYFKVPVTDLYDGLGGRITPAMDAPEPESEESSATRHELTSLGYSTGLLQFARRPVHPGGGRGQQTLGTQDKAAAA